MVGRECERTDLATALAQACAGRGRAVLLLGEAGMERLRAERSMPATGGRSRRG